MKRLRVTFALGSLGAGGSERQTLYLLRELDRSRFEPQLYLLERRGELLADVPEDVPTFAFSDDRRPTRFDWPGRALHAQIAAFETYLRKAKPDVVCERMLVTTLASGPAAKRAHVPRIATFAADPNFDLADQAKRFRWFKKRRLRQAYADAAELVAVSPGVADRAATLYGLDRRRISVVFNPVDLERVDQFASEGPEPFPHDGAFRIVAAGRLSTAKRFDLLLRAVEDLALRRGRESLRLHLLGQGPEEAALKSLANELGVADRVSFEGFAANPYPYLRQSDLFCLSSETEGMPNVLLEAMACRTPVLSTDCVSGPREILDGGRFGRLVPPGDWRALADGIDDAIRNYDEWRAKVEPARRWLETNFSVAGATRKYEELFERAAATRSGAGVPERSQGG